MKACSDFLLVTSELPSIDEWTAPGIGQEPEVNGAPAVVGGVIQN